MGQSFLVGLQSGTLQQTSPTFILLHQDTFSKFYSQCFLSSSLSVACICWFLSTSGSSDLLWSSAADLVSTQWAGTKLLGDSGAAVETQTLVATRQQDWSLSHHANHTSFICWNFHVQIGDAVISASTEAGNIRWGDGFRSRTGSSNGKPSYLWSQEENGACLSIDVYHGPQRLAEVHSC